MPLGEILGELLLRTCFEFVFYGLTYWTGFLFLKGITFGSIRIAPLMSIDDRNPGRRKWYESDWSLWLYQPVKGRRLKAGITCCVGFLVWVAIGLGIYLVILRDKPVADPTTGRPSGQHLRAVIMSPKVATRGAADAPIE